MSSQDLPFVLLRNRITSVYGECSRMFFAALSMQTADEWGKIIHFCAADPFDDYAQPAIEFHPETLEGIQAQIEMRATEFDLVLIHDFDQWPTNGVNRLRRINLQEALVKTIKDQGLTAFLHFRSGRLPVDFASGIDYEIRLEPLASNSEGLLVSAEWGLSRGSASTGLLFLNPQDATSAISRG